MYYYAIIDTSTGVCTFVYESETEIVANDHIQLDTLDTSLQYRKKYVDGEWVDTTPAEAMQYNGMHVAIFGRWLDDVLNDKAEITEVTSMIENIELTPGPQGEQGIQGVQGPAGADGEDGATFIPSVSENGVISWSNNGGLTNPTSVNIRGPQGPTGATGPTGPQGVQGIQGATGPQGEKGDKGDTGATGPQGEKGDKGDKGDTGVTGEDGATFTPSVTSAGVLSWTNDKGLTNPTAVNIKGPKGDTGAQGPTGATGATGPQGPIGPQGPAGENAASAFEGYTPSQFATSDHNHDSTYYTQTQVDSKDSTTLASAKSYADGIKNDLLNGAGSAYDTLKELGDLIDENVDAIEALENIATSKANASDLTSHTGNNSNPHGVTLAQLGVTATAAELNYVDGVTSNIQTQIDGKAPSSHTHAMSAITGLLDVLMTAADGNVKSSASTNDVIAHIAALPSGMHTVYCQASAPNAPNSAEGWRFLVHKTGSETYGWVIAFGTNGSIYTNYLNGGTWRGWKAIYDATNAPLWTGASYLSSADGNPQVVTPSKKLSECRTGWLLLWSDYDPGSGANDTDFCTTIIPKRTPSGGTWGGKAFYCDLPAYVGADATDLGTEIRCIKPIYVHDDCIKGSYQNTSGGRNDIVLRAVYEI